MITKVCTSRMSAIKNRYPSKTTPTIPTFRSDYDADSNYLHDIDRQKQNALNTSLAVVGGALLFTASYIMFSVIHDKRF